MTLYASKRPAEAGGTPVYRVEAAAVADFMDAGDEPGDIEGVDHLERRLDLRNHSPTGFSWGYSGSGPAQLALAMAADAVGPEYALECYQEIKDDHVATADEDRPFRLSGHVVASYGPGPPLEYIAALRWGDDELESAVSHLAATDPDLARQMKWRGKGYLLETRERLRERFAMDPAKNRVRDAVDKLDSAGLLQVYGEWDLDEMVPAVRPEFR